ncbi:hypothetical protein K438DRAFT_1959939 [Mycena galopus ATCC 62051]|nr:hypothetical protein K438DRAFT_1959939 [Mycena galopus ATCC 62051]
MTEPTGIILADLVEGAGGTLHDLAFLLVLHIRCVVWTPQSVVSPNTLNAMLFDGTRVIGNIYGNDHVNSALLSCGVVDATIRALRSLMHSGLSSQSADTTLCFVLFPLIHFLNISPGYPRVRRALKVGLIRLILDAAQQSETVSMYLKRLLTQILTPATLQRLGTRSKRDTSFLCILMHIDYQHLREAILIQHMFEGRGNSPTFSTVWLDYTAPDELQLTGPQTPRPAPSTWTSVV